MASNISKGRPDPDRLNVGGLRNIYVINWGEFDPYADITYNVTNPSAIDAFVGTPGPSAYKFELEGNNSFSQAPSSNQNTGVTVYEQTLSVELKKLSAESNELIQSLIAGRHHIIVEDKNGKLFMMGTTEGIKEVSGGGGTGAAMADFAGYQLTFIAREPKLANFLTTTLVGANIVVEAAEVSDI